LEKTSKVTKSNRLLNTTMPAAFICTRVLLALSGGNWGSSGTPSSLSNVGHTLCVPCVYPDSEWGHETQDTPENTGTSLWHKGLANSDTRSGLEDNITAFATCHQSIPPVPLWDQHLF